MNGKWNLVAAAACCLLALTAASGSVASAQTLTSARSRPSIRSEYLVFTHGAGSEVTVFEDVALTSSPAQWWQFPLPFGAGAVHAMNGRLRRVDNRFLVAPGTATASVVYRLKGTLGSTYVQDSNVQVGRVLILAGANVFPGLETGLVLHGRTSIHHQVFKVFVGGAQGPGGILHFSLTVGNPGIPWADGMAILLSLWLAMGAAAGVMGMRRLKPVK